jgi:hypothetical protein
MKMSDCDLKIQIENVIKAAAEKGHVGCVGDAYPALLGCIKWAEEWTGLEGADALLRCYTPDKAQGDIYVNVYQEDEGIQVYWCDNRGNDTDGIWTPVSCLIDAAETEVETGAEAEVPEWYEEDWMLVQDPNGNCGDYVQRCQLVDA